MRAIRRRIAVLLICVASAITCEIALAEPLYRFGVPPWQRGQSVDDIRRLYQPLLNYLWRLSASAGSCRGSPQSTTGWQPVNSLSIKT